jgi:hypothetical protein
LIFLWNTNTQRHRGFERLEVTATQAKLTYMGSKALFFSESAQADFVCIAAILRVPALGAYSIN